MLRVMLCVRVSVCIHTNDLFLWLITIMKSYECAIRPNLKGYAMSTTMTVPHILSLILCLAYDMGGSGSKYVWL